MRAGLGQVGLCLLVIGAAGCTTERKWGVALKPMASCEALEDELRQDAIAQMERQLAQNLLSAKGGTQAACWYDDVAMAGPNFAAAAPRESSGGGAQSYSTTNNQVAGVDEADFVKNDGQHIYLAAHGRLQIFKAWPPGEMQRVSETPIPGTPHRLFVHADRAVVYSRLDAASGQQTFGDWQRRECTYGYDCEFTGDGFPAQVSVFDISDRAAPKLLRELALSSSFLSARRVGNAIYTVAVSRDFQVPGVEYWPSGYGPCGPAVAHAVLDLNFELLRQENRRKILEADFSQWLPTVREKQYPGGGAAPLEQSLSSCDQVYASQAQDGKAFLTLVAFDLGAGEPSKLTTVVGRPGAVYASGAGLYVASRYTRTEGLGWFADFGSLSDVTTVHKFHLDAGTATARYAGSGAVKGRVLNQFALDEHAGYLRLATTTGHLPDPRTHSSVATLQERDGKLVVTGLLDGLAPTEDIRSVRFDADRAFIVTFKKTDPLFAIDLANPEAPRVAGELKIPGFSTYLHLMDEGNLLSIGLDAEDHGSFAYFQGVQLQIFDVSNMSTPTLTHKEVIGTRGTSSEALTNHLAFNYFKPKGLLAVPMTICEESEGGSSYGQKMTFSGLLVYSATPQTGFSLVGRVPHAAPEGDFSVYSNCYNWWSDASSAVKRSIFMDDFVFSITDDTLKVNALSNLEIDVSAASLR